MNFTFDEHELRIEMFRSGGIGGQVVGLEGEPCVKITHLPTGIVAIGRGERSQLQNKENALRELKERVRQATATPVHVLEMDVPQELVEIFLKYGAYSPGHARHVLAQILSKYEELR